ncbi:MAG TPA: hypothetical protein VHS53_13370 [Mucilaginibacter sp.]|jgi:hypothetical protein|nr:hypothetical protein [Mucilaginibacter sp.]
MKTNKKQITKPESKDPVKEAIGHPSGPDLEEMLGGQENKKLKDGTRHKKKPDDPNIPVI